MQRAGTLWDLQMSLTIHSRRCCSDTTKARILSEEFESSFSPRYAFLRGHDVFGETQEHNPLARVLKLLRKVRVQFDCRSRLP